MPTRHEVRRGQEYRIKGRNYFEKPVNEPSRAVFGGDPDPYTLPPGLVLFVSGCLCGVVLTLALS